MFAAKFFSEKICVKVKQTTTKTENKGQQTTSDTKSSLGILGQMSLKMSFVMVFNNKDFFVNVQGK